MAVKPMTVRVEEGLLRAAKHRALDSGLTITEVVSRLLTAYVEGKNVEGQPVRVRGPNDE